MSVDLKTQFVQKSPRETSGSRSANRFNYQDDWALCKLLEIHNSDDDYVLVLDFHDDIVVLDSASNPKVAIFYQVKPNKQDSGAGQTLSLARKEKKESCHPFWGSYCRTICCFLSAQEVFDSSVTRIQILRCRRTKTPRKQPRKANRT